MFLRYKLYFSEVTEPHPMWINMMTIDTNTTVRLNEWVEHNLDRLQINDLIPVSNCLP